MRETLPVDARRAARAASRTTTWSASSSRCDVSCCRFVCDDVDDDGVVVDDAVARGASVQGG